MPASDKQREHPKLILASSSPRRQELLKGLGLDFLVVPADIEEAAEGDPRSQVEQLAEMKAQAVAAQFPDSLVIGADTVVVLDRRILGKPVDADDAKRMLTALSGRTHEVATGVSLVHRASGRTKTASEVTRVAFGRLTDDQIERYIASGEPMDKAGAYGIQSLGATLIERVDGCYFNVVGLPLYRLARMLEAFGIRVV